jgi:hypothetical protein
MKCDDDDTKGKNNKKGRRKKGILCVVAGRFYMQHMKKNSSARPILAGFICAYDKKQLGQAKKHMRPLRIKTPSFSVYVPLYVL